MALVHGFNVKGTAYKRHPKFIQQAMKRTRRKLLRREAQKQEGRTPRDARPSDAV